MDTGAETGPTDEERERFLKKIHEWRSVGFDTTELEDMLENDFNGFLKKRHEILKSQVDMNKGLEDAYLAAESEHLDENEPYYDGPDESFSDDDLLESDSLPRDDLEISEDTSEDLLLIGEPLPPEEETLLEPEEESVIFVGKFQPQKKTKVHRSREPRERRSKKRATPAYYDEDEYEDTEEPDDEYDRSETDSEVGTKRKPDIGKKRSRKDYDDRDEYEYDDEPDDEYDDEDEYEDEDGEFEEEYESPEDYEEDYDDDEEEIRRRPARKSVIEEEESGSAAKKIGTAIVIMLVVLATFYFIGDIPLGFGSESTEKVDANFEIRPNKSRFEPGSLITLDGSGSKGEKLKYQWILDDDFKVYEGSLKSKAVNGYFIATENEETTKTIVLEVSGKSGKDIESIEITIKPRSFEISPEKIGDFGKYKVTGSLDISNPDGIQNFEIDQQGVTAEARITNILIDFVTKDTEPMTMTLSEVDGVQDGFLMDHSTFERTMLQNLEISGTVTGVADVEKTSIGFPGNEYPVHASIDGTMNTVDRSYTDLETLNTIYGTITNDMKVTVDPQLQGLPVPIEEMSFSSTDKIESYPYLQKDPRNLRIIDLSADVLSIGDQSGIFANNINYVWNAQKVEYVYDKPAIKVNLTIDERTRLDMNLKSFYFAIWIVENISLPVKSHLHAVQMYNDNTTRIKYITEMTEFSEGSTLISSKDCDSSTADGHFYKKHPDYEFQPNSNWSYLPPTGSSIKTPNSSTSFDQFTQEQAISIARQDLIVHNYLNDNPTAYVVSGYCSAKEDSGADIEQGTLHWNLTFGKKNLKKGFNVIVTTDGSVSTKDLKIDTPPNSTEDFKPLLTFAGAEDIFKNDDLGFYNSIFNSNSKIDFESVEFSVETNLQYPNVDITSIIFLERSKYAYQVNYEKESGDGENTIVIAALDAETGQLLFYLDHKDDGFSIF